MTHDHFDPDRHQRHSIRLPGWDYRTQAFYFVTICSYQRENLFEAAVLGDVADIMWRLIPEQPHAVGVILDEWIIMPNHLHGLLLLPGSAPVSGIEEAEEAIVSGLPFDMRYAAQQSPDTEPGHKPKAQPGSLGSIIGSYKSGVTRRINNLRRSPGGRVWQRGYYDHVVRNHHELARIQAYIRDNPRRWAEDRENLDALLLRMTHRNDEL